MVQTQIGCSPRSNDEHYAIWSEVSEGSGRTRRYLVSFEFEQ